MNFTFSHASSFCVSGAFRVLFSFYQMCNICVRCFKEAFYCLCIHILDSHLFLRRQMLRFIKVFFFFNEFHYVLR
jgi:hypothetical protein